MIVALPASGWSKTAKGYRFRGTNGITGALVQTDQLTIDGKGAGWTYALTAPAQGRVALRLTFGTGVTWCASAPAKTAGKPPSTTANDHPGLFVAAAKTPAPATCPPVP